MPAATLPTDLQNLIALARSLRITRRDQAAGRCLSVSLELAAAAWQHHGVEIRLVKWRVVGDPDYADHWAVELDSERVLDLTRIQVDGTQKLVCATQDYPAHYTRRRHYPASLLSAAFAEAGASDGHRLSNRFLWICGTRLLRFDLAAAWRGGEAAQMASALGEFGRFLACFGVGSLTRLLQQRADALMEALEQRPHGAATGPLGAPASAMRRGIDARLGTG